MVEEEKKIKNKLQKEFKNKEILNMEFKMKNLVKGQRYKEAANLKKKILKMQEDSNEQYMRKINLQYRILQENFMKKINNDKLVLEQRLKSEREDLLTRREEDMEMLL